jgi:redox-sensitive bicupin YhaK (pirin superfamily)
MSTTSLLAQRMTAGTGIRHSEKNDHPAANPDPGQPLDLVQMWVVPDENEVEPGYEQLELDPSDIRGRLAVVASGMTRHRDQAAIRIRNRYAALHVARLEPGDSVAAPGSRQRHPAGIPLPGNATPRLYRLRPQHREDGRDTRLVLLQPGDRAHLSLDPPTIDLCRR